MLTQQILDTWLKTCKMIPPGFALNTNLLRASNEEGGWNIDLIVLLLCSPSDLFISWHPAGAHSWCTLLYLCVWVSRGRKEIKEWREGQMEHLSEGCSSVLVNSRLCFHEGPLSSWREPYVLQQNMWCICVCVFGWARAATSAVKVFLILNLYGAVQSKSF